MSSLTAKDNQIRKKKRAIQERRDRVHKLEIQLAQLAEEYRESGIKVSCISSGTINTKMSLALSKVHKGQDPKTFIDVKEVSKLIVDLIYSPISTMWQEEIILKRRKY